MLAILRRKKRRITTDDNILNDPQMNPYYSLNQKQVQYEEDDLKKSQFSDIQEQSIYEPLAPPITTDSILAIPQVSAQNQSTEGPPLPDRNPTLPGANMQISTQSCNNPLSEDDYMSMRSQNLDDF